MKARKRGKGEGSLFQRKDGLWEAKFPFYDRKTRKSKRYSVYGHTQEEVMENRTQKLGQLNGLAGLKVSQLSVEKWLDEWLEKYHRDISESTRKNYKSIISTYITPRIGSILLLELEWEDVQFMYNDIENSGKQKKIDGADNRVSKQTINTIEAVLNMALNEAIKKKLIRENVSKLATKAKGKDPVKRRSLSDQEQDMLYAVLENHPLRLLFELYLETGLRRGEGLGLTWRKIDWTNSSITITESLSDAKGKPSLGSVKTSASERSVKLGKETMTQLKQRKSELDALRLQYGKNFNSDDLVFFNSVGRGYMPRYVLAEFKKLCSAAGLAQEICIHSLRHTHGTVLRRQGTPIEIIQKRLGHSRASITLDTYTHREDEDQVEAVETFSKHRQKLAQIRAEKQAEKKASEIGLS